MAEIDEPAAEMARRRRIRIGRGQAGIDHSMRRSVYWSKEEKMRQHTVSMPNLSQQRRLRSSTKQFDTP